MNFQGIIPALVTPYDGDGVVNLEMVRTLSDRLVQEDIGGLFICGGTGEWWLLNVDERKGISAAAIEGAAGRKPVMVHVCGISTRASVELAQHAESAGADAVSTLPPIGFPYTADRVWDYFKTIGASTGLPLYLYHVPQLYGDVISMDRFAAAIAEIPTLAGVKFSSYRIDDLIDLKLKAEGRLNIISGCSEQLLSAVACGADGSICTWYNFIPRLGKKIFDCVQNNDVAGARAHEDILVAFGKICIPKHLGYVKWLLARQGFDVGGPRPPLPDTTAAEREDVLPKIEATGVFDWCI